MCTTCGCGHAETTIEGHDHQHNEHAHTHDHRHEHHHHTHDHSGHGEGSEAASPSRMLRMEQDILSKNNAYAADNRRWFNQHGILTLNLVSSPGSGKTTLLTRTLSELKDTLSMAVIEGDQQTVLDAERIRATGAQAIQINTGKGCHLDAHMVGHAMENLPIDDRSVLFIENVGNLVCPAAFDLGEACKVVILSVTEGEDKPLKYPDMFHAAGLMLLNKIDLLPHLNFDVDQCLDYARRVNPGIKVLQVSASTGEGMAQWYQYLQAMRQVALIGHAEAER
ncbi:MAG: hydrogenase accessory protein HypB [Zetaproteobacteria bacterium CG_4_9_14_3_um_filter_49_83]|nr:MAG: hydrogenase accessory protein HypB [Zetaproteobacteria bacterium CG1_02_49_23]PIQ34372.1 MAG: hydrogenase accessory protein HypB [Zetaproteobacteria bacterium CG17_big_fil_post_rev_8_21_14_2_50_50_13]PIV30703.1 MAG: hydrogenase accessory protein HypB [Zetaproteobacteria bacterium CG02_land_8_20_14_3_00_50_9]PIY57029.1 MAG: hydrogenase accessory protein HypB [Zetaproteobacteria bacterium CG_4_10_14_0_8_um_filter_49_80]PJA33881.1 MAG: hydrogenase accessory protein HypB [Zetaproteobacteria